MSGKSKVTLETINDNLQLLITKIGEVDEKSDSQFRSVNARFDAVDARLGGVDARLDGADTRADSIQAKITALQKTNDNMARLVARIPGIEERLTALATDVAAIKVRLDNLEGRYQHLSKKVDILYDEYYAMRAALERLEKRMDRTDAERLAERVQLLEQKVAALEKGAPN
jgi:chromosome segregation ATPase